MGNAALMKWGCPAPASAWAEGCTGCPPYIGYDALEPFVFSGYASDYGLPGTCVWIGRVQIGFSPGDPAYWPLDILYDADTCEWFLWTGIGQPYLIGVACLELPSGLRDASPPCCVATIPECTEGACLSVREKDAACGWMSAADNEPTHIDSEEYPTHECCSWAFNLDGADHQYLVSLCIVNVNDYFYYYLKIENTVHNTVCGNWGGSLASAKELLQIVESCTMTFGGKEWEFQFGKVPVAGVDYPDPPVILTDAVIYLTCDMRVDMSAGLAACDPSGCHVPAGNTMRVVFDTPVERIDDNVWGAALDAEVTWDGGGGTYPITVTVALTYGDPACTVDGCYPSPAMWEVSIAFDDDPGNPGYGCDLGALGQCCHHWNLEDPLGVPVFLTTDHWGKGCVSGLAVVARHLASGGAAPPP